MPTFITVINRGDNENPHTAVKACHHEEPLRRDNFFNSQFNQAFPKSIHDQSLGTKIITNIRDGRTIRAEMIQLPGNFDINNAIAANGCRQAVAFGLTEDVSRLIDEWNIIGKEKIKIIKQKSKLKNSKNN